MLSQNFLAGPGIGLMFDPSTNALLGVSKTFTENTFNFTITGEEVRGGPGNMLFGKYYHDSGLGVSITECMFDLDYIGFITGTNPVQGGIVLKEETLNAGAGNSVTLSETPVAFNGAMIGWYRLPSATEWSIGAITIQGSTATMTIPTSTQNQQYCVKYFYQNASARTITIAAQYVPKTIHLVIINDLFPGDSTTGTVSSTSPKAGRLITDIPRFQFNGTGDLTLEAASAATVPLEGTALAVTSSDTCEDTPYYATMVEELYGADWRNSVIGIAVENSEIEMTGTDTATLSVRVLYSGNMPAQRMDHSYFTFAIENDVTTPAPTNISVGANTGIIETTGASTETAVISVSLTDYTNVPPAYAVVTVTG